MGQSLSVLEEGGISYEAFLAYTASMNIPTEFVDVKATFERYRDVNSNLISTEKVAELKPKTDVFLTHDWGIDELGRANHDRVAVINKELKFLGFVTWFDSEKMTGDVVDQMVSGIDNSFVIIVIVTQRYMNKVNGSNANDNCRKEFKYAAQTKSSTKMIPVVMEPRMTDIDGNWTGLIKMELGNILYVDFSNDNDFQSAIQQLKAEILSRTNPLWVLRTRTLTPVSEATSPPLPPRISKTSDADVLMIEQLSSWLNSLNISFAISRRYAEVLVEKNTGSIAKLRRRLEKNSNYLEEIGCFDEEDIIEIKEGLRLSVVGSSGKEIKPADTAGQIANQPVIVVPPIRNLEEDSSMLIEEIVKVPVVTSLSSVDNSMKTVSTGAEEKLPSFQSNIDQEGKDVLSIVNLSPLQLQDALIAKEELPPSIPVLESRMIEPLHSFPSNQDLDASSVSAVEKGKFGIQSRVSAESHSNHVSALSWSPVGNQIASGSNDKTIKVWDGNSLELLKTLEGHSEIVYSVSWNHDGSQIASGSYDKTIKIWDSSTGKELHTMRGHSHWVLSVAWNHDSTKIVSGGDRSIKIWGLMESIFSMFGVRMTWKLLKTLEGYSDCVVSVSWNHGGSQIVSGSADNTIKIWDSSTGIVLRTLTGHSNWVRSVFWSHDDSKIVSCSDDKTVKIWNAITGDWIKTLEGHSKAVRCVAWSPDDRKIASCSYHEKKIVIWDALTGEEMNAFQPVESLSVAWSLDGSELVSSDTYKIKVFSVSRG
jgi:hypothetical protein